MIDYKILKTIDGIVITCKDCLSWHRFAEKCMSVEKCKDFDKFDYKYRQESPEDRFREFLRGKE